MSEKKKKKKREEKFSNVIFVAIKPMTYYASVEDVQVVFNNDILSDW